MPAARRSAHAALAALALAATLASAQSIYRWIDADGKVHYSDQLPKGYTGPVTRIETDAPADAQPKAGVTITKPPRRTELSSPPGEDIASKRRATREELEKHVSAARANLEAARKARDDAADAQPEEVQMTQRYMDPSQMGSRVNCKVGKDSSGRVLAMCPTPVPGDAYYERIRKLDEAVSKAEDDLAAAQEAYRRGVD